MNEIPTISNYAYTSTTIPQWLGTTSTPACFDSVTFSPQQVGNRIQDGMSRVNYFNPFTPPQPMPETSTRRLVKVIIADPNENVPLKDCLLYSGSEQFTDSTDQELFFEIGINNLLMEHNLKRVHFLDKQATKKAGKDVFLEPVRIRDLRMVVVEIAKF